MKFLGTVASNLLNFLVGTIKLAKNLVLISFVSGIALFFLTVFMPNNVSTALEIFKKLLKIP